MREASWSCCQGYHSVVAPSNTYFPCLTLIIACEVVTSTIEALVDSIYLPGLLEEWSQLQAARMLQVLLCLALPLDQSPAEQNHKRLLTAINVEWGRWHIGAKKAHVDPHRTACIEQQPEIGLF